MKKYFVAKTLAVLSVATSMTVLSAAAISGPSSNSGLGASSGHGPGPVMITINPSGEALLRGRVESVGTNSITIKSWGGNWKVNVLATTEIISLTRTLSDFHVGEVAGVHGAVVNDATLTIDADTLRNWGPRADNDHDGIPDAQDSDDDNDGITDSADLKPRNHDNDDLDDDQDLDDDNDGTKDNDDDDPIDHDDDGISDSHDDDDDNDGIKDGDDDDDDRRSGRGSNNSGSDDDKDEEEDD